jgi:cyanate permease
MRKKNMQIIYRAALMMNLKITLYNILVPAVVKAFTYKKEISFV